jgi:hypothetical protein
MPLNLEPFLSAGRAALGRQITYRRGGTSISLTATRGQRVTTPDTADPASLAPLAPTWIIRGNDLTANGQPLTPLEGDEIDHATSRGTETYRVTPDPATGRTWTPSDNAATHLRIHTTRTA